MATYSRNLELVPKQGSEIVYVDLGTANPMFSGILDFNSTPFLETFRIKNATLPLIQNISACSALNVFDLADNFITLQCGISCLSAFAIKKSLYPLITGYIYLTGNGMPEFVEKPSFEAPQYMFNILVNYLKNQPNAWQIQTNYASVFRFITGAYQTQNVVTTGNKSAYIVVPDNIIKDYSITINGISGVLITVNYTFGQSISSNYIVLNSTPEIQISTNTVLYGQTAQLTANNQVNTIQYISHLNGPIIGVAEGVKTLPFIEVPPFEATLSEPTYPSPF